MKNLKKKHEYWRAKCVSRVYGFLLQWKAFCNSGNFWDQEKWDRSGKKYKNTSWYRKGGADLNQKAHSKFCRSYLLSHRFCSRPFLFSWKLLFSSLDFRDPPDTEFSSHLISSAWFSGIPSLFEFLWWLFRFHWDPRLWSLRLGSWDYGRWGVRQSS